WSDVPAFDGTASIIQPLIAPLYGGRAAIEVMDDLLTPPSQFRSRGGYEIVREYWRTQVQGELDAWWSKTLEKGVVENSSAKPIEQLTPHATPAGGSAIPTSAPTSAPANALQIVFRPDPSVWD